MARRAPYQQGRLRYRLGYLRARGVTVATPDLGHRRYEDFQRLHEPVAATGEDRHHLLVGHRGNVWATLEAGIEVGDHGHGDITHAQLTSQYHLRVLGHPDDVGAHALEPLRLGPGGEAGPCTTTTCRRRRRESRPGVRRPPPGGAVANSKGPPRVR